MKQITPTANVHVLPESTRGHLGPAIMSELPRQQADILSDGLSVVIPMHNEAENVLPLLSEVHTAMRDRGPYELIVVDDGSTDATAANVRDFSENVKSVRLVRHTKCLGQSTAIATGIRAASGEFIVMLDGDMQNDPDDIGVLLDTLTTDDDPSTIGCLTGFRVDRKDTWSKRVASRLANAVRSRLLGDATPDTGCGLKLIRRSVFLALPHFNHMHRFLPALVMRAGFRTLSVPVRHRPRIHGDSHYTNWRRFWVGIFDLFGVVWLIRRACNPETPEDLE